MACFSLTASWQLAGMWNLKETLLIHAHSAIPKLTYICLKSCEGKAGVY